MDLATNALLGLKILLFSTSAFATVRAVTRTDLLDPDAVAFIYMLLVSVSGICILPWLADALHGIYVRWPAETIAFASVNILFQGWRIWRNEKGGAE